MGIEPMTSPLPRECSTTEPLEHFKDQIKNIWVENGAGDKIRTCDIHLGRVALYQLSYARIEKQKPWSENGGERRIRTFEGLLRQIYSLLPLAARQPLLKSSSLV